MTTVRLLVLALIVFGVLLGLNYIRMAVFKSKSALQTVLIRLKLLAWALISFGIFVGLNFLRFAFPKSKDDWWFDPARDLALGIFPLGLSILIWEFFLRKHRDAEITDHVRDALASPLRKLEKLEFDGIVDVKTSVSNRELMEFMESAKRNITVLVPFFVEPTVLEDMLVQKLQHRNFVFQIVLLHPASGFLR